ncbi:MAG: MFS transporter [Candidatus Lokiarchaeota archaeon]|nr:MFS transporter [Candidatus Lokiarchaeota archaeon]MBD3202015.1 MFS transporter [Candidatus Lokiarchaeota archaeon]
MQVHPTNDTFKDYIYFFVGQVFSLLGSSVVQFIIPVWITLVYQDEILTSLVYFVSFIPSVFVSPIAGVFADKWNRKKMIALADSSQAITTLILIISFATNVVNLPIILSISFLRSIFQSMHFPPSNAIIPTMVPEDKLSRMNGINYLLTSFINVIGPLIAGFMLVIFPIEIALWIDIITFFIAIIPLILIRIPDIREKVDNNVKSLSFMENLKEGLRITKIIPGLIVLLILATFANFLEQPLQTLLSNFILVDNSGTELILATITGSMSAGIFLGSIIITLKKRWNKKVLLIVFGVLLGNFGYLIVAISPYQFYLMMIIGGVIYGLFLPIVNTMFLTLIQTKVPTDTQGRVISIAILISSGITPLSIIIAGPISKIIGISTLWIIYAILGMVICLIMWFFTNLKRIDKFEKESFSSSKDTNLNLNEKD